nr:probable disease resistance protein At4g27220 [Ziziphus jujuba var. spinosa]
MEIIGEGSEKEEDEDEDESEEEEDENQEEEGFHLFDLNIVLITSPSDQEFRKELFHSSVCNHIDNQGICFYDSSLLLSSLVDLVQLGMEYISNIMNIDEEMDKLKRKSEFLKSREEDVEEELKYAERLALKKTKESSRKLGDIAKTIGLDLGNDDGERRRAAKLAGGLRKLNNFVLILDDVWQHIPLDRVGLPNSGNGCKLIIASRSLEVCRKIGCEEYIKVEPVTEKEAWELFSEKLGHDRTFAPQIEPITKSLTKKCSGLPLGIITMAGCMRDVEDITEWNDTLERMKGSIVEHDDDMGIEVFQVLKYSYDMLKDPTVQQCFLHCSLFPEDYKIPREMLIEHFIDERLVDGMRSRQAELNRGHTILNKLENVCLLEVDEHVQWPYFLVVDACLALLLMLLLR